MVGSQAIRHAVVYMGTMQRWCLQIRTVPILFDLTSLYHEENG